MALDSQTLSLLERALERGRILTDRASLVSYSHDINPLPDVFSRSFGLIVRRIPDAVIIPKSLEELARVVEIASSRGIPIVPRGASTSSSLGSVPARGGILIDLSSMRSILEADFVERYALVEAGVTPELLDSYLNPYGFRFGLSPTSGRSATLGGWASNGGRFGFGIPRFGTLEMNISEMTVVLPDGGIATLRREPARHRELGIDLSISDFIGSEGTLGIIAKLKVTIRVLPANQIPFLASFDDPEKASSFLADLYILEPYFAIVRDPRYSELARNIGKDLPRSWTIFGVIESALRPDLVLGELEKMVKAHGGYLLPEEIARREWERKHKLELELRKLGPTLLSVDVVSRLEDLPDLARMAERVAEEGGARFYIEAMLGFRGETLLILGLLSDERRAAGFLRDSIIAARFLREAHEAGFQPYQRGLVFSRFSSFDEDEMIKKDRLDPRRIMNPGKRWESPLNYSIFDLLMDLASRPLQVA